ncbi:unnamed protein product, partial [Sphacelaria rigidula]
IWHDSLHDPGNENLNSRGFNMAANGGDPHGDAEENLQDAVYGGGGEGEDGGSFWGKSGRWESLPTHTIAVHERGGEEEGKVDGEGEEGEEVNDEDEVDIIIPLDPIELPPSAASDDIWNDQHLQDQLDAYWEQSRKARGGGGGGGNSGQGKDGDVSSLGMEYASDLFHGGRSREEQQRQQQLSTLPRNLQPTYGPSDWVGKSRRQRDWLRIGRDLDGVTEMMVQQEPLPGTVVDGIPRAGNNWVTPNQFEGNQAPINIYGNVYVHLPPGQKNGDEHLPGSAELSARERYYSQGETSWSGSQRGGQ